jgi:shikimate dehydrogenase
VTLSGHTLVFGLVGHPVRHSLSPRMYNELFAEHDIDAVYVAMDVHPDRGADVASSIRCLDLRGVNLTVPFKATILDGLDHLTRAGQEARAVNVVIQHEGHLTGYNTDGEGFSNSLEDQHGPLPKLASAVVLGAGGAARAVASGLAARGVGSVTFLNRTVSSAEASASHLSTFFPDVVFRAAPLSASGFEDHASRAHVVVNCAAGPASDTIRRFDVGALDPACVYADINYWMDEPPLLESASRQGLRTIDGLPMLVYQGAMSFELFTGFEVDARALLERLR